MTLDKYQQAVAVWRSGEAVVAAAAGSGKTFTVVERTALLIEEGTPPEKILILTYNKAAGETLRARLAARIGKELAERVTAATYHAFCYRAILSWHNKGSKPQIVGVDEDAPRKTTLFAGIVRELRLAHEPEELAELDERLREALIPLEPEAVARSRWCSSPGTARTIVEVSHHYADLKRQRGLIDFTDMLEQAVRELEQGTQRSKALTLWQHIMVDEAQDTNLIQQRLVELIRGNARSLMWVGDLRQSIYSFRGAEPDILLKRIEAGAQLLPLNVCYRSTRAIVDAGNRIARGHPWHLGGDAEAREDAAEGLPPRAVCSDVRWVADEIAARVQRGDPPDAFASLCRVNALLPDLECAFVARGLLVKVIGFAGGIWSTQMGRRVRAYLHAAEGRATPDTTLIVNRPLRYAKHDDIRAAAQASTGLIGGLWQIGRRGAEALAGDLQDLAERDWIRRCDGVAALLIRDVRERALAARTDANEDVVETLRALCEAAVQLGSTAAIEEQVRKMRETEGHPAVTLATVHRAKGQEWNVVFVAGANAGLFPHAKADDPDEIEEEARLFYVASTRPACELVYVVLPGAPPSPYLEWVQPEEITATATPPERKEEEPLLPPPPVEEEEEEAASSDTEPMGGGRYVPVHLSELREALSGWEEQPDDKTDQYVFTHEVDGVTLKIYSTIPYGDTVSRECGEDSVRIVALWNGKPVLPRQAWVCRTKRWRENLQRRIKAVRAQVAAIPHCPTCKTPMRLRDGKRGAFWGCLRYPECRGTQEAK